MASVKLVIGNRTAAAWTLSWPQRPDGRAKGTDGHDGIEIRSGERGICHYPYITRKRSIGRTGIMVCLQGGTGEYEGKMWHAKLPWTSPRRSYLCLDTEAGREEQWVTPSAWQRCFLTPLVGTDSSESAAVILLARHTDALTVEMLLVPHIETESYLARLPNDASLASICLPGTHESLARYGWPVSTCQASRATVAQQLHDGIRFLDVRLVPKGHKGKQRLLAYHGLTDERIEFNAVLQQCWQFLDSAQSRQETIIMSIKQEAGNSHHFARLLFEEYIDKSPINLLDGTQGRQRWFLENRIPTLGEARGKVILFSRFDNPPTLDLPTGICPQIWPNSFKGVFGYTLPQGQSVLTQDWYDIGSLASLDAKFDLIQQLCRQRASVDDDDESAQTEVPVPSSAAPPFALNFTSAASFPLALPPAVAKGYLHNGVTARLHLPSSLAIEGINGRLHDLLATCHFAHTAKSSKGTDEEVGNSISLEGLRVIWAMDYYDQPRAARDVVPLLIAANF